MKKTIFFLLLLTSLLLPQASFAMAQEALKENKFEKLKSELEGIILPLKNKIKRSVESADRRDLGNLLLFLASAGLLIYLPHHLDKQTSHGWDKIKGGERMHILDDMIRAPRRFIFGSNPFAGHLYYEILTLITGYIFCKTGKPYFAKWFRS